MKPKGFRPVTSITAQGQGDELVTLGEKMVPERANCIRQRLLDEKGKVGRLECQPDVDAVRLEPFDEAGAAYRGSTTRPTSGDLSSDCNVFNGENCDVRQSRPGRSVLLLAKVPGARDWPGIDLARLTGPSARDSGGHQAALGGDAETAARRSPAVLRTIISKTGRTGGRRKSVWKALAFLS